VADLDGAMIAQVRAVLPCLEHRRDDVFGPAAPAVPVSASGSATARDAARPG
jgi:hypothetical protein